MILSVFSQPLATGKQIRSWRERSARRCSGSGGRLGRGCREGRVGRGAGHALGRAAGTDRHPPPGRTDVPCREGVASSRLRGTGPSRCVRTKARRPRLLSAPGGWRRRRAGRGRGRRAGGSRVCPLPASRATRLRAARPRLPPPTAVQRSLQPPKNQRGGRHRARGARGRGRRPGGAASPQASPSPARVPRAAANT